MTFFTILVVSIVVCFVSSSHPSLVEMDWVSCDDEISKHHKKFTSVGAHKKSTKVNIKGVYLNRKHFLIGDNAIVVVDVDVTEGKITKKAKLNVFILEGKKKINTIPFKSNVCELLQSGEDVQSKCPLKKGDSCTLKWSRVIPELPGGINEETEMTGKAIVVDGRKSIACLKFKFYMFPKRGSK